jgi:hypothetical protein
MAAQLSLVSLSRIPGRHCLQSICLVDDNTALTLDTDTRRSLVGLLKRQF